MENELAAALKIVNQLALDSRYEEALERLESLKIDYPREPWVWKSQGYVYSRSGLLEAAVQSLSEAIELCSSEPDLFFTRGRYLFEIGMHIEAILDFTKTIELSDHFGNDYYREAALFWRADAYSRVGEFDKALADCLGVRDGMKVWTDCLRSKEDIVRDSKAKRALKVGPM